MWGRGARGSSVRDTEAMNAWGDAPYGYVHRRRVGPLFPCRETKWLLCCFHMCRTASKQTSRPAGRKERKQAGRKGVSTPHPPFHRHAPYECKAASRHDLVPD